MLNNKERYLLELEIVLKSGYKFKIEAEGIDVNADNFSEERLKGYLVQNADTFLYVDLAEVAIVRILSKTKIKHLAEHVHKGKEISIDVDCPICNQRDQVYAYCDGKNREYFCFCDNCKVETKLTYSTKLAAIEAFKNGKVQACKI